MTHADEVMRPVKDGVVPTLNARMGTGGNQVPVVQEHAYCVGNGQLDQAKLSSKVGALNCMHDQQAVIIPYQTKIGCLNARDYKGIGSQYVSEDKCIVEAHTYCIQGNTIDRNSKQNGSGICKDVAHTLTCTDMHGVAYSIQVIS